MTKVSINGIEFNAADGEPADMLMFDEGSTQASDTAPWGMVEEMKAFIRIQDEHKLRRLVDIGALFGVFSLVFTRYEDAEAYAFEPSETAFEGLVENCRANPDRDIFMYKELLGNDDYGQVLCRREWQHLTPRRAGDDGKQYPYPLHSLDHLLEHGYFPRCDCIKIDVEGFEGQVLRGAEKTIRRFAPVIFLECHFSVLKEVSGDTRESLFNFFKEVNYEVKTFQGEKMESFPEALPSRYVCWPL